jgi:hypothetical protein
VHVIQCGYSGVIAAYALICPSMNMPGVLHKKREVYIHRMESGSSHIAQVFVWRQGSAPDLAYARQVLSVVNPEAFAAVTGENPPLRLFAISGPWPDDPWERILQDMLSIPAPAIRAHGTAAISIRVTVSSSRSVRRGPTRTTVRYTHR